MKSVEKVDGDTFRIFEMIRQPIVIAFVDLNAEDRKIARDSIQLVDKVLEEVAPAFYNGLIFAYADNNDFYGHRKIMGITHTRVPALSINNNESKVTPYPKDKEMNAQSIKTWLTKFLKGQLSYKESGFGEVIDVDIKYMLSTLKPLKRKEFSDICYEEGKDVFLYMYTSSKEDET